MRDWGLHVSCLWGGIEAGGGLASGLARHNSDKASNPLLMYAIHKTERSAWSNRELHYVWMTIILFFTSLIQKYETLVARACGDRRIVKI